MPLSLFSYNRNNEIERAEHNSEHLSCIFFFFAENQSLLSAKY